MSNGRIIGPYNPSSIVSASGIWNLNDVHTSRKNLSWPKSPSTLSYRANTTGNGTVSALTLTHPSGVVAGDLCILHHFVYDDDDDYVIVAPSGFTIAHSRFYNYTTTINLSHVVSYIVLPNTNNITLPQGVELTTGAVSNVDVQSYTAVYFSLDKPIESVKVLQHTYTQSTGDPAARSITASTFKNVPLLIIGAQVNNTGTPAFNASTTPAFDGTITSTVSLQTAVGYKIYNSNNASDHTIDMDDLSNQQLLALLFSVQ
jgi:hypothetical protein